MVPLRFLGFLYGDVRSDAVGHLSGGCRAASFKPERQAAVEHQAAMAMGILWWSIPLGGPVLLRVLQRDAYFHCAGNNNYGSVPAPELVCILPHGNNDPAYMPGQKAQDQEIKFLLKISSPIAIRIAPPRIEAFPDRWLPAFFPMAAPPMQIPKVTEAIIREAARAIAV